MSNIKIKNPVAEKNGTIDSLKIWLTLMMFVFSGLLLFDNLTRHGLIMGPLQLFLYVTHLIVKIIPLVIFTILCYFVQILQAFAIEKLLLKKFISEKLGLKLQIVNTFFLFTVILITAIKTETNPIITRVILTYIVYTMTKMWSYAYINNVYRNISFKETHNKNVFAEKSDTSSISYPNNISIKNLIAYFIFTPSIEYQLTYPNKGKPNWRTFIKLCFLLFCVYYAITFLVMQFYIPELQLLRNSQRKLTDFLALILRLILPVNLGWLLFSYVNTYKCYLDAYAAVTGMGEVQFNGDWWNSEDINMFWRKWNTPVYTALKCNVFKPLIKNGYSKFQAQLVTVAIAGIIHEYLNTLPFGVYNGTAFVATMAEIPIGKVSECIRKRFGPVYGNISMWMYLFFAHTTAVIFHGLMQKHF